MKIKGYLFLTVALFMMTILFFGSESKAVMTSWSAEQPPEGAKGVEKRTEYRFRDKSTQTSYSTSLDGQRTGYPFSFSSPAAQKIQSGGASDPRYDACHHG